MRNKLTCLQKEIIIWVIFFFICTGATFVYVKTIPNEHEGIIRLHILANSDDAIDQSVKLKVRNRIIEYMDGHESIDDTREYIEAHMNDIEKIADDVISAEGFDYKSRANLGIYYIPEKDYEDLTLPAGNYEALRITLGKGHGHNWWCVIFPNLCLIEEPSETDLETDSETDLETDPDSETVIFKSRIKEKIKSLL